MKSPLPIRSLTALLVLMLMGGLSRVQGQGIEFFHGTYQEALSKASKENKLVFMDAYTSWCGPCRFMSANVFPDAGVGEVFNKYFVNVKMDMENGEGPSLARRYSVMAYPTLLFLKPDGSVLHRELGAKDVQAFIALGKKVVDMR